jgi:hypothetical protein
MKSAKETQSKVSELELPQSGSPILDRLAVSVVVPVVERPGDLSELYREYSKPLRERGWDFEFLFFLEPWAAPLREPLAALTAAGEPVRVLEVGRAIGEAGQLKLAGMKCRADIVVTLPAYHRVDAECLPVLIDRVSGSVQLAIARRWPRRDAWLNRLQNRVFHAVVGAASSQPFRDIACGVRAMRRELLREIPLYGDFSRFLPLLAVQDGFSVEEVPCAQHPRDRKARVYSFGTYIRRIVDLLGIFFLLRFTYRPLRFFGVLGGSLSSVGGAILIIVFMQRLMGQGLANRPLLLLGVLLFTIGVQVAALGLVGELIVHLQAPARPSYRVRERI